MLLSTIKNARKLIKGVVPDPEGKSDLDVHYKPDAITPQIMKQLRDIDEDTAEEDGIRNMLVSWGVDWNLRDYVQPVEGDPAVEITLEGAEPFTVKADDQGEPVTEPIPATFEGMQRVSLRVLFVVMKAIQEDARPKETTSVA
jgi:hypothetical protein